MGKSVNFSLALIFFCCCQNISAQTLRVVAIDCDDKVNILQNLFDRDQEMRKAGGLHLDSKIDHENLEIAVSYIETCGMPTLKEVEKIQIAGLWLVFQHAPPEYQTKYLSLFEESARNGDLRWSLIALMRDRALMYEGKPQIYGSQIKHGALFDLFEPEYVNQRREEMEMVPIEDYLERFGIEFKVVQKLK